MIVGACSVGLLGIVRNWPFMFSKFQWFQLPEYITKFTHFTLINYFKVAYDVVSRILVKIKANVLAWLQQWFRHTLGIKHVLWWLIIRVKYYTLDNMLFQSWLSVWGNCQTFENLQYSDVYTDTAFMTKRSFVKWLCTTVASWHKHRPVDHML